MDEKTKNFDTIIDKEKELYFFNRKYSFVQLKKTITKK